MPSCLVFVVLTLTYVEWSVQSGVCMCRALGAVPFSSETEMVRDFLHVLEMPYSTKQVLAGIVFTKVPPVCRGIPESNLEYKLRFPSTLRSGGGKFSMSPFGRVSHWMTQYMFPVFQKVGPRKAHSIQGGPPGRNALLKYGTVHTHTHPFNGPFSGTTRVGQYQKGKTNLDFTEAGDSEWQWHQLGQMQVCTSLQTDNHASTSPLSFFTGRMPFLPPNQQCQSTEGTEIWYST